VKNAYITQVMASAPLMVLDLTKISKLDVPTSACKAKSGHVTKPYQLGPLELHIPSVSFNTKQLPAPKVIEVWAPHAESPAKNEYSGLWIPVGYSCAAILMLLGNVLVPHWLHHAAILVSPIWSVSLLMHTATQNNAWFWLGICLLLVTPLLVILRDISFVVAYILTFSAFVAGNNIRTQKGVWLVIIGFCSLVIATGAALSIAWPHRANAPITVSCFTSLVLAVVCTRHCTSIHFGVHVAAAS
jgi:hypothetical protein